MSIWHTENNLLVVTPMDLLNSVTDVFEISLNDFKSEVHSQIIQADVVLYELNSVVYTLKSRYTSENWPARTQLRTVTKPGYHTVEIPKGELGKFSKIKEEFLELEDAVKQESGIMSLIELADLYGAIEAYLYQFNLDMTDLQSFSGITKRAFENGRRS